MHLQQCCLHMNSVYRLAFPLLLDVSTEQRSSVPGEHLTLGVRAPQALPHWVSLTVVTSPSAGKQV